MLIYFMDVFFALFNQIDSSICSNINHEAFGHVFSTFTKLLFDKKLPLNLKVRDRVHVWTQSVLWVTLNLCTISTLLFDSPI